MTLQNLVEAYGDETDEWKGKEVLITTEQSERTQGKKSIVVKPSSPATTTKEETVK